MLCDCHIHMVLDGCDWRRAIDAHRAGPDLSLIRARLARYQELGFVWLRDGGDRWGVGAAARTLAADYGIRYRTPLAPLYRAGHYGRMIGLPYENITEYARLVQEHRKNGADFIKIMISGIMDFDRFGALTDSGRDPEELRELVRIAHEEGFAVMAHCNGARTTQAAAEAGVDSIEHGAYQDEASMKAMLAAGCVWVPTLSTIGNLRGTGRFREDAVEAILADAGRNAAVFAGMGGLIAPGTDAGAWAVLHGSCTEYTLLRQFLGPGADTILKKGCSLLQQKF